MHAGHALDNGTGKTLKKETKIPSLPLITVISLAEMTLTPLLIVL